MIKKCIKLAQPRKTWFFGTRIAPPKCPNLDSAQLQALQVVAVSAGHFPCIKPRDGKTWQSENDQHDRDMERRGIADIKRARSTPTAVLLTRAHFPGRVVAHATLNGNLEFLIDVTRASYDTFPHEFGHRIGWTDISGTDGDTSHSDDRGNIMYKSGGSTPDCQLCQKLLDCAK